MSKLSMFPRHFERIWGEYPSMVSMPFIALILVVNKALMLASIKHRDAREEETEKLHSTSA